MTTYAYKLARKVEQKSATMDYITASVYIFNTLYRKIWVVVVTLVVVAGGVEERTGSKESKLPL